MARFILISLKRKLPLFIITLVLFAHCAFIIAFNASFEVYEYYNNATTVMLLYVIVFMLIMLILPLFSMNYRYSLAKSDLFRQVPYKSNRIRYIEHLTTLGIILIGFTLGYFFSLFAMMIRNHAIYQDYLIHDPEAIILRFNYGYFALAYLPLMAMGIMQYFISYLFISRSNNLLNSIVMLFFGEMILLLIYLTPIRFFHDYGRLYNSSVALPCIMYEEVFEQLIVNGETKQSLTFDASLAKETLGSILYLLQYIVYAGIAILGFVAFLIEKDPSSEYAGKPKTNRPYQEIIFHLGAFIFFSTICGLTQSLIYFLISYVFFLVVYYTLFGILNRNFVPKIKDVIIIISVSVAVLLYCIGLFIHEWYVAAHYNAEDLIIY